jgi:predicted nuclease of predicted toxin-antitoxin system
VKFLVDRCAGTTVVAFLRAEGFDTAFVGELPVDPGDVAILEQARLQQRVLVTLDTDFGKLVFKDELAHAGVVRLPDIPPHRRVSLLRHILEHHSVVLKDGAVITADERIIRVRKRVD